MFVLFEDEQVAKIAVKTMHGYMLLEKQLRACIVKPRPGSEFSKKFKSSYCKFKFVPWKILFKKRFNKAQSDEAMRKKMIKLVQGDRRKVKTLADLGIEYQFPSYVSLI